MQLLDVVDPPFLPLAVGGPVIMSHRVDIGVLFVSDLHSVHIFDQRIAMSFTKVSGPRSMTQLLC